MGFNYAREKAIFEEKWNLMKQQYKQAGMTDEAIESMHDFDWRCFCSQRTYVNHTQEFPETFIHDDDEASHSTLLQKFSVLTTEFDENDFPDRYAWVDTIDNPKLVLALKEISEKDLELLTFLTIEEHNQSELAQIWNCSQNAVSKRFLRVKKFLKNFLK